MIEPEERCAQYLNWREAREKEAPNVPITDMEIFQAGITQREQEVGAFLRKIWPENYVNGQLRQHF